MDKYKVSRIFYQTLFKPLVFSLDAEMVHNKIIALGESLENCDKLVSFIFAYQDERLKKKFFNIELENPIGLAAGFDYDGHLAKVMKYVGFGFNTVGTVTAKPYEGNLKPRLARLPRSKSLLVNKGFKSSGALAVAKRLDKKNLVNHVVGISIGSTNTPKINSVTKAIDDYLFSFDVFKKKKYISYFELNISCPNTTMTESFINPSNFKKLTRSITSLRLKQPILVKMPNEIEFDESDELVKIALKFGIKGFIFSNLVKDRLNPAFIESEIARFKNIKGNFSGKPTSINANKLISHTRKKFGKEVIIIGCGGVFNVKDALEKFASGADLIQLITGMIFEGPQIVGEINSSLAAPLDTL